MALTASFSCRATANPAITGYQWYIGAGSVETRTALSNDSTYDTVTTRTLNIIDINADMDGNEYSCKVTNPAGSTWTELATLTVLGPCITCGIGNSFFWDPTTPSLDAIWDSNTFSPDETVLEFNNSRYELIGPTWEVPFIGLTGYLAAVPDRVVATLGVSLGTITWGGWTVRSGVVAIGMDSVFMIRIDSEVTFDVEPNTTTTRTLRLYGGGDGLTLIDTVNLDATVAAHVFSAIPSGVGETTFYMDGAVIFVDTGSNPWSTGLFANFNRNQNVGLTQVPWIQNIIAEKDGTGLPNTCCPGPESASYWSSTSGFIFS